MHRILIMSTEIPWISQLEIWKQSLKKRPEKTKFSPQIELDGKTLSDVHFTDLNSSL